MFGLTAPKPSSPSSQCLLMLIWTLTFHHWVGALPSIRASYGKPVKIRTWSLRTGLQQLEDNLAPCQYMLWNSVSKRKWSTAGGEKTRRSLNKYADRAWVLPFVHKAGSNIRVQGDIHTGGDLPGWWVPLSSSWGSWGVAMERWMHLVHLRNFKLLLGRIWYSEKSHSCVWNSKSDTICCWWRKVLWRYFGGKEKATVML